MQPTADDADPTQPLTGDAAASGAPPEAADTEDPLPTMADLDQVASELDDIDTHLAALDQQRP